MKQNMSGENQISDGEKALRIFNALNDYYTLFPDRQSAPSIVITQDWDVFLDYKGEPCESDFKNYATMFMEDYEAEEWVYTKDTIRNCIPIIQKELDTTKKICLDLYGVIPTHEKNLPSDLSYFIYYISLYTSIALRKNNINDWVLEIDLPISEIFLVMKEMRSPSYGGLILHYDPMKLIKVTEQGEMIVDNVKVRELAERICQGDLTGEFANDDDDEGGEFFNNDFS